MLKFACFWGKGFWKHYHRGRQRAIDNLKASFPDKDDAWIEQTGIRSFERLLMLAVDVVFIPQTGTKRKLGAVFAVIKMSNGSNG